MLSHNVRGIILALVGLVMLGCCAAVVRSQAQWDERHVARMNEKYAQEDAERQQKLDLRQRALCGDWMPFETEALGGGKTLLVSKADSYEFTPTSECPAPTGEIASVTVTRVRDRARVRVSLSYEERNGGRWVRILAVE